MLRACDGEVCARGGHTGRGVLVRELCTRGTLSVERVKYSRPGSAEHRESTRSLTMGGRGRRGPMGGRFDLRLAAGWASLAARARALWPVAARGSDVMHPVESESPFPSPFLCTPSPPFHPPFRLSLPSPLARASGVNARPLAAPCRAAPPQYYVRTQRAVESSRAIGVPISPTSGAAAVWWRPKPHPERGLASRVPCLWSVNKSTPET